MGSFARAQRPPFVLGCVCFLAFFAIALLMMSPNCSRNIGRGTTYSRHMLIPLQLQPEGTFTRVLSTDLSGVVTKALRNDSNIFICGCGHPFLKSIVPLVAKGIPVWCLDPACQHTHGMPAGGFPHNWKHQCYRPRTVQSTPSGRGAGRAAPQQQKNSWVPDDFDTVMLVRDSGKFSSTCVQFLATMHPPQHQMITLDVQGPEEWNQVLITETKSLESTLYMLQRNSFREDFEDVYSHRDWGEWGGGSGLGSSLNHTGVLRKLLPKLLIQYKVKSMIDSSCGAMVWMPEVIEKVREQIPDFTYLGLDVACALITNHTTTFADKPYMSFRCLDVSYEPLPSGYDLVFSRDSLQHLPISAAYAFLYNIARSSAKYLLVGSYVSFEINPNRDVESGAFYSIDLLRPPFNVHPPPLYILNETDTSYEEPAMKSMLLLDVAKMDWDESPAHW